MSSEHIYDRPYTHEDGRLPDDLDDAKIKEIDDIDATERSSSRAPESDVYTQPFLINVANSIVYEDVSPADPEKTAQDGPDRRKGDWMETFMGHAFWPLDPRPSEVDIRDIAHSLSLKTRFNGQCKQFYSVAEHAIRCALQVLSGHGSIKLAYALLHHDSSEAYLPDVPRPIKPYLTNFKEIENGVQAAINEHFGINPDPQMIEMMKRSDNVLLATEARDLMQEGVLERWNLPYEPLSYMKITPWPSKLAEERFKLWNTLLSSGDEAAVRAALGLMESHGVL